MRVSNPYANKQGATKIAVSLALGEVAQYVHVLGASRQVTVSFDAAHFTAAIAPALAVITPQAAQQAHEAGVTADPVRESRKRVARAPKVADPLADLDAKIAAAVGNALAAALQAQAKAAPAPRKPRANKRDEQIAEQIKATA